MARISVWYVRAALLHFAVGASAGAWRLAASGGVLPEVSFPVRPLHVEGMLLGWVCQLAFGVALWILPFSDRVSTDRCLWGAWAALNGGILLVVAASWGNVLLLRMLGRFLELSAGLTVLRVLWPRVRRIPHRKE